MKPLHRLLSVRLVGWSVTGVATHTVFGAVTTIVLARGLGPQGLGGYGVFLALAFLISQVGSLGLGTAYVKLATPELQASRDVRVLSWTFLCARLIAVGTLAALALLAGELLGRAVGSGAVVRGLLFPGIAAALLMAVGTHYHEVLRARFAHKSAAVTRGVMAAARMVTYLALMLLGLLTLSRAIGLAVVMTAIETAMLATFAHRGVRLWPPVRPRFRREWVVLSWWLFLTGATGALLTHTDTLLLAGLGGSEETGLWVAASRLIAPIPLLVGAVWSVALPISMALTDMAKLERYLGLSRRTSVASLILAGVGTVVVAPVVSLVFGATYLAAVAPAQWLLVAFGANIASILYGGLVHRLGFERALAGVSVFLLAVNAVGDLLLIPAYGAAGCAAVTAGVMFLGATWTVWRVERDRDRLLAEPTP